jgi:hypothetical protein
MSDTSLPKIPDRVAEKVERVLGIPRREVEEMDTVQLIEDLCDTALMFDRDAADADELSQADP